VQAPACGGHPAEAVAAAEVLGGLRPPLDELEDEDAALGQVGDDCGAHTGFRGSDGVVVLVLTVDREKAGVLCRDADDVGAAVGLDLVVHVGQSAGELGDGVRAAQLGNELEDFVDLDAAAFHVA
jgi:hypothetical protein